MNWSAHGEWQITVHGPLLVYQVRGAWNEQGALAYARDCAQIGAPLFGSRWAVLGDLRDWQLATMECIPIIRELAQQSGALGCVMQVLLPGEGEIKRDCLQDMVPTGPEYALHFADDSQHAARILAAAGFADTAAALNRSGIGGVLQQTERRTAESTRE